MSSSRLLLLVLALASLCAACGPKYDTSARYSVVVIKYDEQSKISGIKALREETGLGLADAKRLIESSPGIVKTQLSKAEAEALVARLSEARVTTEVRRD
jgi:large subunit ribosomal protein L7/L12